MLKRWAVIVSEAAHVEQALAIIVFLSALAMTTFAIITDPWQLRHVYGHTQVIWLYVTKPQLWMFVGYSLQPVLAFAIFRRLLILMLRAAA
jgi:hypothetical protein